MSDKDFIVSYSCELVKYVVMLYTDEIQIDFITSLLMTRTVQKHKKNPTPLLIILLIGCHKLQSKQQ